MTRYKSCRTYFSSKKSRQKNTSYIRLKNHQSPSTLESHSEPKARKPFKKISLMINRKNNPRSTKPNLTQDTETISSLSVSSGCDSLLSCSTSSRRMCCKRTQSLKSQILLSLVCFDKQSGMSMSTPKIPYLSPKTSSCCKLARGLGRHPKSLVDYCILLPSSAWNHPPKPPTSPIQTAWKPRLLASSRIELEPLWETWWLQNIKRETSWPRDLLVPMASSILQTLRKYLGFC